MSERKESMINHEYNDKIIEKRRSGVKSEALKKKKEGKHKRDDELLNGGKKMNGNLRKFMNLD